MSFVCENDSRHKKGSMSKGRGEWCINKIVGLNVERVVVVVFESAKKVGWGGEKVEYLVASSSSTFY